MEVRKKRKKEEGRVRARALGRVRRVQYGIEKGIDAWEVA